jgi:hypothetical protein
MPERRAQLRSGQRPIEAIIEDGTHHFLPPSVLDVLLEHNKVIKFRRSSGWVTVGIHPIRFKQKEEDSLSFVGPDKRSTDIRWH